MNDQTQEQPVEIPQEVRAFLDSLLQDANMTFTDDSQHEEMIQEIYARLDYFLTSRIIEAIPPEHLDAFTKMSEEEKNTSEIEKFLQEKIPDAQTVMQNAFTEFRNLYIGNVAVSNKAPAAESDKAESDMHAE